MTGVEKYKPQIQAVIEAAQRRGAIPSEIAMVCMFAGAEIIRKQDGAAAAATSLRAIADAIERAAAQAAMMGQPRGAA